MNCPHCSRDIPIGQQFCNFCGKRVEVGFDHIQKAVLSDAADRRGGHLEKVLINVIGALVVIWVGIKLYNDYYLMPDLPFDSSASVSFSSPRPSTSRVDRLPLEVDALKVTLPEVTVPHAQGMSWRRGPFKTRLREEAGGKGTEKEIDLGLTFLAKRQQKDGGWTVSGDGGDKKNDWGRVGVTALACLAFTGDGHTWVPLGTDKDGKTVRSGFASNVKRGIRFLTERQDASGRIGPESMAGRTQLGYMYNHGMATAALAEAYAMSGDPQLAKAAQRAVNFILTAQQQKSGGWDYTARQGDRADTSITGWQVQALCAARSAGLKVPDSAFTKALGWIDSVTDPQTFRVGYDKAWSPSQEHITLSNTAIAAMLQLELGRSPSSRTVRKQSTLLLRALPEFDPAWSDGKKAQKLDYYYTYHATTAMHRLGGQDWETWNAATIKALRASQEKKGALAGAWPTLDIWSQQGGRIYSTALALLTLEVYYRYP